MTSKALEPFPRSLRLIAKAAPDIAAKFAGWVKLGELPAGAILARFVGTASETRGAYIDELTGERIGEEIDEMQTLCHLAVISKGQPTRLYLIVAPADTN